jgi:hypothetical protein
VCSHPSDNVDNINLTTFKYVEVGCEA